LKSKFNKKRRRIEPELTRRFIGDIDYKKVKILEKSIMPNGKLFSGKKNGLCAKNQRQLAIAVKRARYLGLIPYIGTTRKD